MSACWSNPPDSLVDLDYRANLNRLAQLAVPMLGDWCAIHVVDDAGDIVPVALAHGDPQKVTVRAGYRNSSPSTREPRPDWLQRYAPALRSSTRACLRSSSTSRRRASRTKSN